MTYIERELAESLRFVIAQFREEAETREQQKAITLADCILAMAEVANTEKMARAAHSKLIADMPSQDALNMPDAPMVLTNQTGVSFTLIDGGNHERRRSNDDIGGNTLGNDAGRDCLPNMDAGVVKWLS